MRRLILALALVALATAGAPGTALAHAELVSTTPAANVSLPNAPDALSMTFSEAVDPASASVRLIDEAAQDVALVEAVALDPTGTTVHVGLPALEPGVYTVSYRITSAVDGHVSIGTWAFLVDPSGTRAPPATVAESSSPSGDLPQVLARWLALAGALAIVGTCVSWGISIRPVLARASQREDEPRVGWIWLALAAYLAFAGLAAYLTLAARPFVEASGGHAGHGSGGVVPLDFAAPFGATPFATAMRVAEAGIALAAILATSRFFAHDEARRRGAAAPLGEGRWLVLVGVAGGAALAGFSLGGHAAAAGGPVLAVIDWGHLLAVAAWLGSLPAVLALGWWSRGGRYPGLMPAVLVRHSRVALVSAPIVALTGVANSPFVLGSARGLVDSGYGNEVLAKVVLFSVALGLGAVNFFLVRAASAGRVLRAAAIEVAAAALAVFVAAALVTGQPAAGRTPVTVTSAIGAVQLAGASDASRVHLAVNLPNPGVQRYQVSVRDAASGAYRTDVQRVFLVFVAPPEAGLPAQRVQLQPGDVPWLWGTAGAYTPVVGDWRLQVVVRRVGELDETVPFDVPVVAAPPPTVVPPPSTGIGAPAVLTAAWGLLPSAWLGGSLALGLIGVAGLLAGLEQLRVARLLDLAWVPRLAGRGVRVASLALAVAGIGIGVTAGSRLLVELADQAPPAAAAEVNPAPATDDSVARGQRLYLANCSACHGATGAGDGPLAGEGAGSLPPLGSAVDGLSDGSLAWRIAVGTATTRMPAFAATLSPADRWDLVNFLRTSIDGG